MSLPRTFKLYLKMKVVNYYVVLSFNASSMIPHDIVFHRLKWRQQNKSHSVCPIEVKVKN